MVPATCTRFSWTRPSVAERYFSPGDVEALIPALTNIMEGVMKAHTDAAAVEQGITTERQRIALAGGSVVDREAWRGERARLEELTRLVQEGLGRIVALGGVPKDLSLGLVDFPHRRRGEVVNLCWKLGERDVRFWHGLDEGYAARKPL
jgi:hypothetical protein